jgi:hypothetical protein
MSPDASEARVDTRHRLRKTTFFKWYSQHGCNVRARVACASPPPCRAPSDAAMTATTNLREGHRFRAATRPIARKCANSRRVRADVRTARRIRRDVVAAVASHSDVLCAGKKKPAEGAGFFGDAEERAT